MFWWMRFAALIPFLTIGAAICTTNKCIRKCCFMNVTMSSEAECIKEPIEFVGLVKDKFNLNLSRYEVIESNVKCKNGQLKFLLNYSETFDKFEVENDGSLYILDNGLRLSTEEYCLDWFEGEWGAFVCQNPNFFVKNVMENFTGMIISIPFLFATLLVYLIIPDKNIYRKCQMAYVCSLMFAYIFLITIQLKDNLDGALCSILASLCLFSFMSSFCWMNVSCIDIFWTFSGKRGFGHSKRSQQRRFLLNCAYAYGAPLVLLGIIFIINSTEGVNKWYHPSFAISTCWLASGYPNLLYFYGPMGLMLLVNVVLFALTAYKLKKIQQETNMLHKEDSKKHYESEKQRFNLYFKVLLAMGINWFMEFLSWLVDWLLGKNKVPQIWYLTDLCNALYGVFIFFLFVWKKQTLVLLKKRYYVCIGKPQKARALSTLTSQYTMSQTEKTNMDSVAA